MTSHLQDAPPRWAAVASLSLGVFGLVAAEFFPASLLTPIARDLQVTEALAGQAVTTTALVALVSALATAVVTRRLDRRVVILGFTILLILSNVIVALAGSLPMLFAGRVLIGVALGGFWSMAPALAMRLVPEVSVPRALALISAGVSAATIFAAPVGAFVGDLYGWRSVFWLGAAVALGVLVVQAATLPRLTAQGAPGLGAFRRLLVRPGVRAGIASILVIITGHFALFTYVRPFLETVSGAGVTAVTLILLGFGLGNFFGTFLAGAIVSRSLKLGLILAPVGIAAAGILMASFGGSIWLTGVLVAGWGLIFGLVPVGWTTWITRMVPDESETGGGIVVASFQAAITSGAVLGGIVFDAGGPATVFLFGGVMAALGALVVGGGIRLPSADRPALA